jgi:AraC-like DNA-binding protein
MSRPSHWKLTPDAIRHIIPRTWMDELKKHPLTTGLYPTSFGYYPHATEHSMVRNAHDDWLLLYCVEGRATLEADEKTYSIRKGDLVILPFGLNHKYWADDGDPWSVYWLHFEGIRANDFLQNLKRPDGSPVWHLGLQAHLIESFQSLFEIREKSYRMDAYIYESSLLRQMLSFLGQIQVSPESNEYVNLNLDEVHAYMQHEIRKTLDLDELASHFNMSRFYFAKVYQKLSGTSPIAYFISRKIKHACFLLDTTTKSIGEIADELDYSDTYYFSRLFKRKMGYSPKHYRLLNHRLR